MDDLLLVDVCDRGLCGFELVLKVIRSSTIVAAECVSSKLLWVHANVVLKPIEVDHFEFFSLLVLQVEIVLNQGLVSLACNTSLKEILLFLFTRIVIVVHVLRPPIHKMIQIVVKFIVLAVVIVFAAKPAL